MAINGIKRIGHICFPAAAVTACRIGTINPVALQGVCQIRLLLHPGIGGKRAGTLTQISYFISLILRKADEMTGTRRSVFSFRTQIPETRHPVTLSALVTDAGLNQLSSTSSSASFYIGGSSLPRRAARRRIASQARLLKKHFAGASGCKIDDKVDTVSSLGHAPVFRSLNAPCDGVMISHDLSGVEPFPLRRFRD